MKRLKKIVKDAGTMIGLLLLTVGWFLHETIMVTLLKKHIE